MITSFPEFSPLQLIDKPYYEKLVFSFPPISDFNFATLMMWWNLGNDLEVASLNTNVVVRSTNSFKNHVRQISFIGNHKIDESFDKIFAFLQEQGQDQQINLVPECALNALQQAENFAIEEDENSHEYILSTAMQANLADPSLARRRRGVRRFVKTYGQAINVRELDLNDLAIKLFLINNLHTWDNVYHSNNDQARDEGLVINTALLYATQLGIKALGVFVQDKLASFIIYQETQQPDYAIAHHLKTNYDYSYIFDFTVHTLACTLMARGRSFINVEMDLGLPGLRFHKQSLRPVSYLKKFIVRPRRLAAPDPGSGTS